MQEMDNQVTPDVIPFTPKNGILSDDKDHYSQIPIQVPVNKTDERYKMDHNSRGRAIIFCHVKFDEQLKLEQRVGGEESAQELKKALENLGFNAVIHDDLDYSQIIEELNKVAKDEYNLFKNEDCILIAVMTHGGNEDQLYAKNTHYTSEFLQNPFVTGACPGLAGKPKIYILQACRGEGVDKGTQLQNAACNSSMQHSSLQIDGIPSRVEDYKLPKYADFVTAYSSSRRFSAYRKPFIKALSEELSSENVKYGKTDFLSMLTDVLRKVAIMDHEMSKQMPSVTSTLTRKIFFSRNQTLV